jgi:very-short-patch-repair endonuclease
MADKILQKLERAALDLAEEQHEVVTSDQLRALDFSSAAIKHRVAKGWLHPLFAGVYAVRSPRVTRYGWWMAGVLACGDNALLSHASAAALWGVRPFGAGDIEVSVPAHVVRDRPGIKAHRRAVLGPANTSRHRGIPVTSPVATLIDIAPRLSRHELEGAVSEADRLGLIDHETLREELDQHRGWRGVPKLRTTLDRRTYVMTDTELERLFLPIARRAGLPLPLTQAYVNGFRVDFYWPDLGLVVETDGLTTHRTPAQQAAGLIRDQTHAAGELVPLRFSRGQVKFEPGHVEEIVRTVARRLEASRRGREG